MTDLLPTSVSLLLPLAIAVVLIVVLFGMGKVPINYNVRNLIIRWKNTAVTALAFTLVIALLVVMLAFVRGMNQLTEGSHQPGNVMILSDGATDEAFSNITGNPGVEQLPDAVQKLIQKSERGYLVSKEVFVIVNKPIPNPPAGGPQRRFLQMRGIEDPEIAAQVHNISLREGKWFSPKYGGVREIGKDASGASITAKEVVLGEGVADILARDMGKDSLVPGDVFKIRDMDWVVTGIMKSEGSTFASEIWALDQHIQQNFGKPDSYSVYVARTENDTIAELAVEALKKESVQGATFQVYTEKQYFENLNSTSQGFLYAIVFVAIWMALGGALSVMNTMFAAISQRAKDIGVLRLLGYSRGQVLVSFLLESLVIALIGGILGCAVGSLAHGYQATSVVSSGAGGGGKSVVLQLIVDGNILAMAMLLTLGIGLVGGLIPSISAMRLRPLESLR
jgi:putative ABC transport system permease protein